MTKDWDAVRPNIKQLSVDQKKCLEDVKSIMETRHGFRASTRAYRMKLKEWGYLRHRPRKSQKSGGVGKRAKLPTERQESESEGETDGSHTTGEGATNSNGVMEDTSNQNVPIVSNEIPRPLPTIEPLSHCRNVSNDIIARMLEAVLEGDSQKLEQEIVKNPNYLNYPIGLPFEAHGGRFFNHPAIQNCIFMQHPDQRILDIASALPDGPVMWLLMVHGARGSTHPLGTDLALQNAIKNGRTYNVQALINSGQSYINRSSGTSWSPLMQAVFWNMPDIVRCLLDKGALVNQITSSPSGKPLESVLQMVLNRRVRDYSDRTVRDRTEEIILMLLNSGADVHVTPMEDANSLTPFETFLKPWHTDSTWLANLSRTATQCLEAFIRSGADLDTRFSWFPCPIHRGDTLMHQVLWHSTPQIARALVDHAVPTLEGNGSTLLQEIVGCCPHAKRHPADTLRDIEVLFKRGCNPNVANALGDTPLTACIQGCPNIDLVPRLKALLDGGCDPEWRDGKGRHPIVLATQLLEEPVLSQAMDILVSKCRGRRSNADQPLDNGYLPIDEHPNYEQLLAYFDKADFEAEVRGIVPGNVIPIFRKSVFNVASQRFLDAITQPVGRFRTSPLSAKEFKEMHSVMSLRQEEQLPDYHFDQNFVLWHLLAPQPKSAAVLAFDTTHEMSEHNQVHEGGEQHFSPTLLEPHMNNLPTPLLMDTPQPLPISRRGSSSSISSNGSTNSFFIASTTQIRFPSIGRATKQGDVEKAMRSTLKYKCQTCNNGLKLTKEELKRHQEEHLHSLTCYDCACKRRFCGKNG